MENDKDWWKTENLLKAEQTVRLQNDPKTIDPDSDFGSYRRVLLGDDVSSSKLAKHNDLNPLWKIRLLKKYISIIPETILDAGCGMGYTTAAIASVFNSASVLGVDISKDAIDYARKKHPGAKFDRCALPGDMNKLGKFDLIFCFEFYPFTRNRDIEAQTAFIRSFTEQLTPGGYLIIFQMWKNPNSLSAIFRDVRQALPACNFKVITIPSPRILRLVRVSVLAVIVSKIAGFLLNLEVAKKVVLVSN